MSTTLLHPTSALLAARHRIVRLQQYLERAEAQGKATRAQMTMVALVMARDNLAALPPHACADCGRLTPAPDLNDVLRCDACENLHLEASAEYAEEQPTAEQAAPPLCARCDQPFTGTATTTPDGEVLCPPCQTARAQDEAWQLTVCDECCLTITGEPRLSKSGKRFCTPCADRLVAKFYAAHPEHRPAGAAQPSAYRIVTTHATFAVESDKDDVVRIWAPAAHQTIVTIGRWSLGQPMAKVLAYYTRKGAQITALAQAS